MNAFRHTFLIDPVMTICLLATIFTAIPATIANGTPSPETFHSGGEDDASVTYPPGDSSYQTTEGCRFYPSVRLQPWQGVDHVIEGFDWSLPPGTRPSPHSFVKGAPPEQYPGNRIESINTSWRAIEPEEGRFDFSGIEKQLDKAKQTGASVELHVRASVWDIEHRDASGSLIPCTGPLPGEITAPRWLQAVVPSTELTEPGQPQKPGSRTIINCNIYQPEYHNRYLRMVRALGASRIAKRPELAIVYIHMISGTAGEENDGVSIHDPQRGHVVRERITAWADAFGRLGRMLAFTGYLPENLAFCYQHGVGQRNGLVECYLLHTHNPAFGQSMDPDGHMIVDETLPPIANNLMFGDENEEYATTGDFHVERFGPRVTWNHRYREATLRMLQMRRNYAWEPYGKTPDPYLSAYLSLELGRKVADAPDAWCYLRESMVHQENIGRNPAVPVKNFERWLVQRDLPGEPTVPSRKIKFKDHRPAGNIFHCYVPGMNYDHVARSGRRFGFALDDRFIVDEQHPAAIKITYYDDQPWKLVYQTRNGPRERSVPCRGDGVMRTATLFVPDAVLAAKGGTPDFEVRATGTPATLRFVRVVRTTPQPAPATPGISVGTLVEPLSDEFNGERPDLTKQTTSGRMPH